MSLLHEQYDSEGQLVLFRCTECEYVSLSLGADYVEPLMDRTEVLRVNETEQIELDAVEGL